MHIMRFLITTQPAFLQSFVGHPGVQWVISQAAWFSRQIPAVQLGNGCKHEAPRRAKTLALCVGSSWNVQRWKLFRSRQRIHQTSFKSLRQMPWNPIFREGQSALTLTSHLNLQEFEVGLCINGQRVDLAIFWDGHASIHGGFCTPQVRYFYLESQL